MTEHNFSKMSNQELKRYVIAHREDDGAWAELLSRRKPNAKSYPPPLDEEGRRIAEQAFREKFGLPFPGTE